MKATVWRGLIVSAWCLTATVAVQAGPQGIHSNHTSRTYFGPPGVGPYGPVQRYSHPWTASFFGVRCCPTPEEKYERFLQMQQIARARCEVEMNRLNWDDYYNYLNPPPNSNAGHGAPCNCGRACGPPKPGRCEHCGGIFKCLFSNHGCGHGKCDKGDCGAEEGGFVTGHGGKSGRVVGCGGKGCGLSGCNDCGKRGHHHGMGPGDGLGSNVPPYRHPGYPAMNPEDAVRYIEGFQYYPPYHLMRSPRDFYMFDVKYGIGK